MAAAFARKKYIYIRGGINNGNLVNSIYLSNLLNVRVRDNRRKKKAGRNRLSSYIRHANVIASCQITRHIFTGRAVTSPASVVSLFIKCKLRPGADEP